MNAAWHRSHRMPEKATLEQRVAWHREHQIACACRPVPASLRAHVQPARAKAAVSARRAAPAVTPALDPRFAKLVAAFADDPAVSFGGKGFGSTALKHEGKIFAMFARGRFVARLSAARVDELVAEGRGERFQAGSGRPMKEWLATTPASTRWLALAREALRLAKGS